MSRILTKTVFEYAELSDEAKKRARQDHVEQPDYPYDNWYTFDDFVRVAELMGIEIDVEIRKTERGSTYAIPKIHFSGFSSQGDGASFEGSYKWKSGCVKDIAEYAPRDEMLKGLVERLAVLQVAMMLEHGNTVEATITRDRSSNYSHSMTMNVDVFGSGDSNFDGEEEVELTSIIRSFADWIYSELSNQYDYYFDDDYLAEELQDSGIEFNEDGSVA